MTGTFPRAFFRRNVNVLAFDIETIPDVEGGRRLYGLDGLEDADVAQAMFTKRREQTDREFLPPQLHRVLTISAALRTEKSFKLWSLGSEDSDEKEIITRFFDGIERYTPTLVTWNGGGFDLPVLHHRAMIHLVPAPRYWDTGTDDQSFRFNNYLSRYHYRHTDLMDVLNAYQGRGGASLDQMAQLCGLPGKMGMDGAQVWDAYLAGRIADIRNYCEVDALNTYLLYLRWLVLRGDLTEKQLGEQYQLVLDTLMAEDRPHVREFVSRWRA